MSTVPFSHGVVLSVLRRSEAQKPPHPLGPFSNCKQRKWNAGERSNPHYIRQTTAQSLNEHKKRQQQHKPWPGWGGDHRTEDGWKTWRTLQTDTLPRGPAPLLKKSPSLCLAGGRIMTLSKWATTCTCINHPSCLAVNYSCLPSE